MRGVIYQWVDEAEANQSFGEYLGGNNQCHDTSEDISHPFPEAGEGVKGFPYIACVATYEYEWDEEGK